jgi:hypothetical protein
MLKKFLPVLLLPVLFAGCQTQFYSTNLTPLHQVRTTNNLYTVEVAVASHQQTLRWDSIHPQVVVGHESYNMRPTPLMTNRWEGLVPVPAGTSTVRYRYRFDFEANAFGAPQPQSAASKEYTLRIVDQ